MAVTQDPVEAARLLGLKIEAEVKRAAGMGLAAAIRFLAARVKEALNVPHPARTLYKNKATGERYYHAARFIKATPNAPPRKITGRLQGSITSEMISPLEGVVGSNARAPATGMKGAWQSFGFDPEMQQRLGISGANYPAIHEHGSHKFLQPTFEKYEREVTTIVGQPVHSFLKVV
jgi:hypothetical protein